MVWTVRIAYLGFHSSEPCSFQGCAATDQLYHTVLLLLAVLAGCIEAMSTVGCPTVSRPFAQFAYGYGSESDHGWGCAYRCVQMMYSALGTAAREIPNIVTIQERLVTAKKMDPTRIGSQDWIEPHHAAALLSAPHGQYSVSEEGLSMLFVTIERQLRENRLPVMVDDSIKAYIAAGLRKRSDPASVVSAQSFDLEDVEVLVFDPHVDERPTPETMGTSRSAVRWIPFLTFFREGARRPKWMFCCPNPPSSK